MGESRVAKRHKFRETQRSAGRNSHRCRARTCLNRVHIRDKGMVRLGSIDIAVLARNKSSRRVRVNTAGRRREGLLFIHCFFQSRLVHFGSALDVFAARLFVELPKGSSCGTTMRPKSSTAPRRDVVNRSWTRRTRLTAAGSLLIDRSSGDLFGDGFGASLS